MYPLYEVDWKLTLLAALLPLFAKTVLLMVFEVFVMFVTGIALLVPAESGVSVPVGRGVSS